MAGLTTMSGTGTQTATQSPQAAVPGGASPTQPSGIQPGTASSLLNGQGGLTLHTTALSTVSLGSASQQAAPATNVATPVRHQHVNLVLIGLAAGLLLVALVSAVVFSRQVKSTTI